MSRNGGIKQNKGQMAEEMLRNYFLGAGYFVVRGIPYTYQGFTVTDVDLWLYNKPSAITRERLIVDIKSKKTPQALERIFWTLGLTEVLGLDGGVVVTSDYRKTVSDYGFSCGVVVLDGNFQKRLTQNKSIQLDRLSDEDIRKAISDESPSPREWKAKYDENKSRLLSKMSFDGCNQYLEDIYYWLGQLVLFPKQKELCTRLMYYTIACFLVCVDFVTRNIILQEQEFRKEFLINGFRYGVNGESKILGIVNLLQSMGEGGLFDQMPSFESEVSQQSEAIQAEMLAEFLSTTTNHVQLFELARRFEMLAFGKTFMAPSTLNREIKSIIGLICDFHNFDRKHILAN